MSEKESGVKEKIEMNKKVIVEVGTEYGIPVFRAGKKRLKEDEMYVSVDLSKTDAAEKTKRYIEREKIEHANVTMADAKEMPFKDATVDEVIFTNVFGEMGYGTETEYYEKYLEEAARVLKKGGKIVITETYTPHAVPENMSVRVSYDNTIKLDDKYYEKFGLSVFKKTTAPEDLEEYHQWGGEKGFGNFQLILIKE